MRSAHILNYNKAPRLWVQPQAGLQRGVFPLSPMNRTKCIKIRLTDNEHRQLKARAGARGVSSLLRIQALGPDRRQKQREQFALIAELARARNLLNQIARNFERRMPS